MANESTGTTAQRSTNRPPNNAVRESIYRHGIMALPYKAHPIYNLRKFSIIIALIGIVLCCLSSPSSYLYYDQSIQLGIFWLIVSLVFFAADVFLYAVKKAEKPDEDPEWPKLRWMVTDVILAGTLLWVFALVVSHLAYRYGGSDVAALYGVLAALLCSMLHIWAFWKQLMAKYKKKWIAGLQVSSCQQCGHVGAPTVAAPSPTSSPGQDDPPSASTQEPMFTPGSTEATMEEGLLISAACQSYGSIEEPEACLEEPEEVVIGKKSGSSSGKQSVKKTQVQMV